MATASGRTTFANSSVALLSDLGFDGLEIDWESPADSSQARNFVSLLKDVRCALDDFSVANRLNYKFALTASMSANPKQYSTPHFAAMDKYLDYWSLSTFTQALNPLPLPLFTECPSGDQPLISSLPTVAYDYAGNFTNVTAHASNLYPSDSNKLSTPFSTQHALRTYLSAGVPSQKIILGMPLYGRAFLQTAGLGKPYRGVGNGSWGQEGIWDYKDLPMAGAREVYDSDVGGSYSHTVAADTASGYAYGNAPKGGGEEVITYDNKETAERKARYIVENGLGGGMWWESSGDKAGDESLIGTVAGTLERSGSLDKCQNWLKYPTSRYENMRNGMRGE